MGKVATEHLFTGTTAGIAAYDQDKTILGTGTTAPVLFQQSGGWAGPIPIGLARPNEVTNPYACGYPHAISITPTLDWIFLAELSTGTATRRVILYTYDKSTQTFNWRGFINLVYPIATVGHTVRALRVARHLYTTGTAAVSGTAVTGTLTAWQTARYAAGARIGFGSTDPTQITTWYYISSIGNDTTITLTGNAGTVVDGPFVIEELRVITVTTNTTVTNGGVFLAKGVNFDDFSAVGTNIAAAVSTDNVKAVYWLKDASTETQTISAGAGYLDAVSNTQHDFYALNANTTTTLSVYKYNLRAALTVSSGASTDAFVFKTGISAATTGTIPQTNNGRYAVASHGPGSGIPSIYFVTVTRVYRITVSSLWDTATNFISDGMVEIPAGTVNTFAASGALSSIEYASVLDRFVITTSGTSRQHMTKYQTMGDPFDHYFVVDTKQLDQSTADPGITPYPNLNATAFSVWVENGMLYMCRNGSTTATLNLYAVPIGVQWDYAATTNQRIITPRMATPNCSALYRVYANETRLMGTSDNLGTTTEPFRIYARTSGISDNSGTWILIPRTGELTGITPSTYIQFAIEFRICGITCIPAKIYSLTVIYEDDTTDSHFQPSAGQTVAANSEFGWRHSVAFGGAVPALRVRLYNAVTNDLLVDDNTTSATGHWERSTDGGSNYVDWTNADKGNETTYVRYTPQSLASGLTVRALLTQL